MIVLVLVLMLEVKVEVEEEEEEGAAGPSSPSSSAASSSASSILILSNVLHIPKLIYNVVSAHALDGGGLYTIQGMIDKATIRDKGTGAPVGFTKMTAFMPKFRLVGQKERVTGVKNPNMRPQTFEWLPQDKMRWQQQDTGLEDGDEDKEDDNDDDDDDDEEEEKDGGGSRYGWLMSSDEEDDYEDWGNSDGDIDEDGDKHEDTDEDLPPLVKIRL